MGNVPIVDDRFHLPIKTHVEFVFRMRALEPNKTHLTLAELEDKVRIVTQNVDGLHSKAGSKLVEELHGSAHRVICLTCSQMTPREDLQNVLLNMNPGMELTIGSVRPDGDVDMNEVGII